MVKVKAGSPKISVGMFSFFYLINEISFLKNSGVMVVIQTLHHLYFRRKMLIQCSIKRQFNFQSFRCHSFHNSEANANVVSPFPLLVLN